MLPVCICADGYEHSYNKKHCVAKGEDAVLLVAVENDILRLNPYVSHKMGTPGQEGLFDNNLSTFKIDSMDVYYNEGDPVLFMSLKNNGSIASIKVGSSSEDVGGTFESIEVIVANAGEVYDVIFSSLAAGTFVYIAASEIIVGEFSIPG